MGRLQVAFFITKATCGQVEKIFRRPGNDNAWNGESQERISAWKH
jgi:hypothetical protein